MHVLRRLLPFTVILLLLAFSASGAQQDVTFVQISDAHLFDAGKKRTPPKNATPQGLKIDEEKRRSEKLDTWAAWDWALGYVKHLTAVQQVDFVVFTGDFGLEKVTDQTINNIDYIDKRSKVAVHHGNQEECWLLTDAVEEIANAFQSLPVERIYVVPGNNDIDKEDPSDGRFDKFIAEVNGRLQGKKVIDLTLPAASAPPPSERGYRIVGLDSSSFKNKSEPTPTPTPTPSPAPTPTLSGCPFVAPKNVPDRDAYQLQELQRVAKLVKGPTLIFTHIPDMDDPFCVRPGAKCSSVASWNLSYAARETWNNVVNDSNVRAVFAGHFHDSQKVTYKNPYGWTLTQNDKNGEELQKTYVAPPLSPKFQTENVNEQARGFALATVTATDVVWKPYWLNTLPLAGLYQDSALPSRQRPIDFKTIYECWAFRLAIAISVAFLAMLLWKRNKYRQKFSSSPVASGTSSDVSRPWAEHLFQEWKYRHDNYWRMLYRFMAAIAILVTAPFIKSEYFGPLAGVLGSSVYALLPFIIFIALCFALAHEQAKLKCVERRLENVRQGRLPGAPEKPDPWKEMTERWKVAIFFVAIGLLLWAFWTCELLSRYAGKTT
jgi:hypothetical protein